VNPAWSIIFFTTAAGAGYGLLAVLALQALRGSPVAHGSGALLALGIGSVLVTSGLLSSTLHLGHPERAWRALTQWRSSWLSREGVLALACYPPLLAWAWRLWRGENVGTLLPLVVLALALATVYATSMIYASLKTVDAWHRRDVPLNYLLHALASGAVLWLALCQWRGQADAYDAALAALCALLAAVAKLGYWRGIGSKPPTSSLASATGLGATGPVSSLAWPHSEANYLLKEMGYVVARRHAVKLRRIALVCAYALPLLAALASVALSDAAASVLLVVALLSLALGLAAERWLFFAEAKHSVALYYGRA